MLCNTILHAQNVGIGTTTPNGNAKLEVADSNKGILIPRIDSAHRVSIPNTQGLLVYETNSNCFWYNDGTIWLKLVVSIPVADKYAMTHMYLIRGF